MKERADQLARRGMVRLGKVGPGPRDLLLRRGPDPRVAGCYAEALRREERLLPVDDLDGRLALAKKYPQYGQPEDERVWQFVQESLTRRWQSLKAARASSAAGPRRAFQCE